MITIRRIFLIFIIYNTARNFPAYIHFVDFSILNLKSIIKNLKAKINVLWLIYFGLNVYVSSLFGITGIFWSFTELYRFVI